MQYWLVKSEPESWSWQDHLAAGITKWDGVRNYQARNFMKEMRKGDLAFFYQSVKKPQIKGIVEVVREHYPDPGDKRFVMVDLRAVCPMKKDITLKEMRQDHQLKDLLLWKQSRLSVMPINECDWLHILTLGGLDINAI